MSSRLASSLNPAQPSSPSSIPKQNTALLICDFQTLTLTFFDSDPTIRTRITTTANDLRTWAISSSIPVYHCTVDTTSPPKPHARISERWDRYATKLKENPDLGAIIPELLPLPPSSKSGLETIYPRSPGLVSALSSPGILDDLHRREIRSLIIVGVSTSGCLLSTVRDANEKGFVTTVVEDGCADPAEGVHEVLCRSVLPMTAHVVKGVRDVVGIYE